MKHSISLNKRAVIFAIIGTGLVTGWLRPIYEVLVGCGVYVPNWWVYLHLVSLAALIFLAFFLRDRPLRIICWCVFGISVFADAVPDYVLA